jgi:peptidoglycan/xylan/chitin deacetylase (PgdA/CDA1 family)
MPLFAGTRRAALVAVTLILGPGSGPAASTPLRPAVPARWQSFAGGAPSRLAVLLTDTTAPWLPLAHGLTSIGIPFEITRDYHEALTHRVVFVYPVISGRALSPDALHALSAFDGTLIATNVLGGGMAATFGFADVVPSRSRATLTFAPQLGFADPRESTLRVPPGTYGYTRPAEPPLATFDDGTAALTRHGRAYALGVDLGALLAIGYQGRDETMARAYDNAFEPTIDVWLRVLRRLYVDGEPDAVTLGTVPAAKPLSVMITHDVDYTRSVENSLVYAAFEHQAGIPATYFVQTKYLRDYNDDVFFDDTQRPRLARLAAMGMELASHSVAHSRQFATLPVGTGEERYPAYRPFVRDAATTVGASVLGELRVSKFLLETVAPGDTVTAFRPGYLAEPRALPQALAAAGYRYSSSTTADVSLTHLPFALDVDRQGVAESGVTEFPVTIEDEAPPRMDLRLPAAIDVARRIARYGGELVVLIHPNVTDYKLRFEQGLVAALRDSAWFGTVSGFGRWWSARASTTCDVTTSGATVTLRLTSPTGVDELPVTVPATWGYVSADPGVQVRPASAHTLIVHAPAGAQRIVFRSETGAHAQ